MATTEQLLAEVERHIETLGVAIADIDVRIPVLAAQAAATRITRTQCLHAWATRLLPDLEPIRISTVCAVCPGFITLREVTEMRDALRATEAHPEQRVLEDLRVKLEARLGVQDRLDLWMPDIAAHDITIAQSEDESVMLQDRRVELVNECTALVATRPRILHTKMRKVPDLFVYAMKKQRRPEGGPWWLAPEVPWHDELSGPKDSKALMEKVNTTLIWQQVAGYFIASEAPDDDEDQEYAPVRQHARSMKKIPKAGS